MKVAVTFASVAVLLASAGPALAGVASIETRELAVGSSQGGRSLAVAAGPTRFNLVGLQWQGSGSVEFRTRSASGRWSAWRPAAPEDEDRPDRMSGERSVPGWRLGNPYWTGTSTAIRYRTHGVVRRLRAHFVWSPVEGQAPARTLAVADAPPIVTRAQWNANELIRRGPPSYATSVGLAVVHHTAGANNYTRAESAAIVRGIQLFHVQGNGWNDIGYNFLVDRYGQVFEGRYGGVDRPVIGAHAEGFNTGSAGVAVLGRYDGASITPAARAALVRLLAWRLDVVHADPLSTLSWSSGGNAKFPRGRPVALRAVSGHRDTGFTECPGDALYATLDQLARDVAASGGPKLYAPAVRGAVGAPIRFTARLSAPLPWTVTVTDAAGAPVTSGSGSGTAVDWTWDATAAPPGSYTWTIGAGPTMRPATGALGARAPATLTLTSTVAEPAAITPNGDGRDDLARIGYTLSVPALVTATLADPAGATLATLFSEPKNAGPQSFTFTAEGVADGTYTILLTAIAANGRQVTAAVPLLVNRTLSRYAVAPARFSPNGDGRADGATFTWDLAAPATVRLRILRAGAYVTTVLNTQLLPGPQQVAWDGRKRIGRLLDGDYEAELTVTDVVGSVSQRLPLASDTRAPKVTVVSSRPLRLRLSEPATVTLRARGAWRTLKVAKAGVFAIPPGWRRPTGVTARDDAANVSKLLKIR
jgi:hypothetical protein